MPIGYNTRGKFQEAWRILFQTKERKTLVFSLLNLFLGMGYAWGVFSSNAMLISRTGTSSLFQVYLGSALAALAFAGILYRMVDRLERRRIFFWSFIILGTSILLLWLATFSISKSNAYYFGIRVFSYAVFILTTLQFWLLASDYFTNFEARIRYPYFIAFGVIGEILGSFSVHRFAPLIHAGNFLFLWGVVLLLCPFLLLKTHPLRKTRKKPENGEPRLRPPSPSPPRPYLRGLFALLLGFWVSHVFMAYGLDYFYNTTALVYFRNEDALASFYGKVALFSLALVLLYQLFFASALVMKFGVERSMAAFGLLYILSFGWVLYHPSLLSIAFGECLIFFFVDLAAQSLLQPVNKVFPERLRGRIIVAQEAFGIPGGTLLLLLVASLLILIGIPDKLSLLLFSCALAFPFFPFLFGRVYFNYLLDCIRSHDEDLVVNAVHALGEPGKKDASGELLALLDSTESIPVKRAALLSLGRIQGNRAFTKILQCFSIPNESIQLAVVESLSHFEGEQGVAGLFQLILSNENVSFQVRMSATLLLTRLQGKKMRPLLLDLLKEDNDRVKANAIESLALLRDPETIPTLLPFLAHESRRIRANTAIALYPFRPTRPRALETVDTLFRSREVMEMFSGIYAIGELRLGAYRGDLRKMWDSPDKRLRQHVTLALAKMGDPEACERVGWLLLDPEESFVLETARNLSRFPQGSRNLVFEKISRLPPEDKTRIVEKLDQTPLDFSLEKEMLLETEWMAPYLPT